MQAITSIAANILDKERKTVRIVLSCISRLNLLQDIAMEYIKLQLT